MSFSQNLSENTVFYEIGHAALYVCVCIRVYLYTYVFPCVVFSICKLENNDVFGFLYIRS